jgi:hypothetical protein
MTSIKNPSYVLIRVCLYNFTNSLFSRLLIEDVTRKKIFDSTYWQQHCFYLTAETLVDKAVELRSFGGAHGALALPSDFLCLLLKMLLIQPEPAIPLMFIEDPNYRYIRLLGAFYIRLTASPKDCYELLEPLYLDYRKLRMKGADNTFSLVHMDECIDQLLNEKQFCNIHLPPMVKRYKLEEAGILQPRISPLQAVGEPKSCCCCRFVADLVCQEVDAMARRLEHSSSSSSSSSSSESDDEKKEKKRAKKEAKLAKKAKKSKKLKLKQVTAPPPQ